MKQTFFILFITLIYFSGFSQKINISAKEQKEITRQILKIEYAWAQTFVSGNFSILEKFLADDYVGSDNISSRTKSEELESYRQNKSKVNSATTDKMKVHVFTANAAVVTGELVLKGLDESGKPFNNGIRFTGTYVKRNQLWQCVSAHASELKN